MENNGKEKSDENSGQYVIASSRPPEHRPLERCTLVPRILLGNKQCNLGQNKRLLEFWPILRCSEPLCAVGHRELKAVGNRVQIKIKQEGLSIM